MPIYRHDENIRSRAFEIQSKADADFCDLYAVLGLKAGASAKDIKTAYRALAKRYHPDRARSDPAADHKIKDINRAYAILSSPAARAAHDRRWAQLRASRPVRLWRRVAVLTATAAGMTALAAGIAVNLDYRLPPELHADSAGVSQIARSPQLDRRPRQASDDVAAMPEQPFGPGTPAPPPKSPAGEGLVPDAPVPSLVREPSMVREIGYFAADRIHAGKPEPAPAQTARSAETGESTPEPVAEPGGRDREHRARIEQQYREERTEERQQRSLAEQSRRDNERRAEIAQQQRDAQAAQRRRQALAAQQRRDQERREAAAQAQRERLAAEKQESMARARLEQRETERREEAKRQSAAQQQARTSETLPYSLGVNTGRRSSGASRWWPFENVSNAGGGGGGPGSSGSSGGGNSGSGSGGGGGGSGGSGSSGGGGSGSSGSGGSGGGGSGESGGGSGGSGGGGGGHGK